MDATTSQASSGLAFLFPGQGSQSVGMGREFAEALPAAAQVFEEADDALGFSLSELCWQGPEEELQLTANTQPAILTASVAVLRHLEHAGVEPAAVAGHSLGEYSAAVACGALEFADAVRLVRRRGELMQRAVPVGEGAMAAVLGLEAEQVTELTRRAAIDRDAVCTVANLNTPEQIVIAGTTSAVELACERALEAGAKRTVMLPVSAPFHSPLMAPAREGMTPLLEQTRFEDPRVPLVNNVDAVSVSTGAEVRDALIRQIDSSVRWVESMQRLVGDGFTQALEVGAGSVLTGMQRKIDRSMRCSALGSVEALHKTLDKLAG